MNLPLPPVISARTGKTGRASLAALRAGERDPSKLAQVRACRISASAETLARALVGDGREEPLFTLRQALSAYRHYQPLSAEWDQESERWLAQCASQVDPTPVPLPPATTAHRPPQRNEIPCHHTDLRTALYRLLGGALTQGPGCQTPTRAILLTALGPDLSAFPPAKHCAAGLGLCPDNRVSGGRVRSAKTPKVRHRAAAALRLAAQSLHHTHSALGDFDRRMRARLGAPKAITATAPKLARLLSHRLTTGQAYDESVFARNEERYQQRRVKKLYREAAALGYTLAPQGSVS